MIDDSDGCNVSRECAIARRALADSIASYYGGRSRLADLIEDAQSKGIVAGVRPSRLGVSEKEIIRLGLGVQKVVEYDRDGAGEDLAGCVVLLERVAATLGIRHRGQLR